MMVRHCLVASALVMMVGCSSSSTNSTKAVDKSTAAKLLIDRNWIDVMPTAIDSQLHVYRFVPNMGGGVYQDRTIFQGSFELFVFSTDGEQLDLVLPHKHERAKTGYRIEHVDGPEPFDLKLTLTNSPRGPSVYYSVEQEVGSTAAALDAQLPTMLPKL